MPEMQPILVPLASEEPAKPSQPTVSIKVSRSRKQISPVLCKALYRSASASAYFRDSEEYELLKRNAYQAQQISR